MEAIENALQSSHDSSIMLSWQWEQANLQVTVADSGPGFSAEALEKAFDPFYSGNPAPGRAGLGLSEARRLVEAHGGRVSVANRQGWNRGGRLLIELPDARVAAGKKVLGGCFARVEESASIVPMTLQSSLEDRMNDNYPDIPNEPDSRGSDVLLIHEGTRSACSETAWRHLEQMVVECGSCEQLESRIIDGGTGLVIIDCSSRAVADTDRIRTLRPLSWPSSRSSMEPSRTCSPPA